MRKTIIFVMGPTCAGKSTFLQLAASAVPEIGLVEVGKALRAKYPPEHFAGQCNPSHTAGEAWDLCKSMAQAHLDDPKKLVVLVDGQPRDRDHVAKIYSHFVAPGKVKVRFILIDASLEERERRARASRTGDDLEKLALPRLRNDMMSHYEVIVEIIKHGGKVEVFDSSNPRNFSVSDLFSPLVRDISTRIWQEKAMQPGSEWREV